MAWRAALTVLLLSAASVVAAAPLDVPFPGVIELRVDARDLDHRVLHVEQRVPVSPGEVTLLYPQWLPGNHAPRGPIEQLAGLTFTAGGKPLDWQRDPLNVNAFRVRVPEGTRRIDVAFDVATPQSSEQGRVVMTARVMNLQWNQVVLYPDGYYTRRIPVAPRLRLPEGWQQAGSLTPTGPADREGFLPFPTTTLERLVDSPVFAGAHGGRFDLAPAGAPEVRLNVFADNPADIAVSPEQLAAYRAMVRETTAALGPPRYERYDFLLALTDALGGIGLEHLRSSENTHTPGHFRAWDDDVGSRDKLAHEFAHSWNGKYRRPARLWTPTFNVPMQDDLLWVYEGLTQYYGLVLTARAGLWSPDFTRATLATVAATYDRRRPGRAWRPLADTTHQPIVTARRPISWTSWQRTEDYYSEGALVWFEVDMRLRELTNGARTLDDFSRAFFAARPTQGEISTYELADVVATLGTLAKYDWAALLRQRLQGTGQPLDEGLKRAGWRLVYDDQPNAYVRDGEKARRNADFGYSLGVTLNREGQLTDVVWGGPAFAAGLAVGTTVVAVQGRSYASDLLTDAIRQAQKDGTPVELLVKTQDRYRTVRIDYREGIRWPRLVREEGMPDRLADLLKAQAPAP